MPQPEGRQSPPPERQSGAQLHDPPGSGVGLGHIENKEQLLKEQIANLTSNPKGPMEDHVKAMFAKQPGNFYWEMCGNKKTTPPSWDYQFQGS